MKSAHLFRCALSFSMPLPLIIDAHEDLAYNVLNFGRDYLRAAVDTRRIEKETHSAAPQHNGETLLGWPDYQRGRVAVVFSTLFATPERYREGEWEKVSYGDADQAERLYRSQLDIYHDWEDRHPDAFRLIGNQAGLADLVGHWKEDGPTHPVGLVPLMEGAEALHSPGELAGWWQAGLRIIGLAWAGTRFCGGTREPGPLTAEGRALLDGMADLGFTLDLSHMDELSARQALDRYPGPIIASHANAAAVALHYEGNRQLPDAVIKGIIARQGVIGVIPYCRFLDYSWKKGDRRDPITLQTLAVHIDHICQLAGDARNVGLGSDFDGGFGLASVPADVDTIADLQSLGAVLSARGYNESDVAAVLGGNWLHHLQTCLPA
jgi:membrane dipeptidase